jgi:hypothetical protein
MLLALIEEKATILSVDADTIHTRYEAATQDLLEELLAAGWQFSDRWKLEFVGGHYLVHSYNCGGLRL